MYLITRGYGDFSINATKSKKSRVRKDISKRNLKDLNKKVKKKRAYDDNDSNEDNGNGCDNVSITNSTTESDSGSEYEKSRRLNPERKTRKRTKYLNDVHEENEFDE